MKLKGVEHYIIRFETENNVIKILKAYDKETLEYITKSLDFNDRAYIIIKRTRFVNDFAIKCLLDYEEGE